MAGGADRAAWNPAGVTCAPTQRNSWPVPLSVAPATLAAGTNAAAPAVTLVVLWRPAQLPIGSVLPPEIRLAGSVNCNVTGVLARPLTLDVPPEAGAMV